MARMVSEGDARVGLRERKKQETRLALSWAAIKLGIERGVDNVRVEDIAAEAGVSLRTFRNYFSGKAEAIAARHLTRARRVAAALRERPPEEPLWEAIGHAVEEQFTLDGQQAGARVPDRQWIEGVRLLLTEPALQGEIHKVNARAQSELAAVVAERTGTDAERDLYPRLVAAAVGAAVSTAIEHWLRTEPPVPVGPLLREAVDRLAAGLPVP